jgi:hypothetical protein
VSLFIDLGAPSMELAALFLWAAMTSLLGDADLPLRIDSPNDGGGSAGPWAGGIDHLVMVTYSGLAAILASMAEGEMAWRLLGWEEPLTTVWLRQPTGCSHGVPPLLEGVAAVLVGSSWRSPLWSLCCSGPA